MPSLEIRSVEEINGASGAFSEDKNTIYLSQEFIAENSVNIEAVSGILLEEIGHAVDSQVNNTDAPGDEGEIFSALVRGEILESQQLQDLKVEDDTATVTLDGDVIKIEQATVSGQGSVSDSGGFEGSQGTIKLSSNGGGKAKYSYEHFSIPDNFILRYEGKNILETGFVGGNKTGTVQIPKGQSDELEVIVTTNDEGTAWNYNVTTDNCPDTTPFNIELEGGQFKDTDGDGDCDGQGTIYIGRTDGISRMLRVENATAEFDDKSLRIMSGTVFSEIGNVPKPLFQGSFEILFSTATTSSFQETGNTANEFQLGGLNIDFKRLKLDPNQVILEGGFALPEAIGKFDIDLNTPNTLVIGTNGVGFSGGKVEFPNTEFNLFKLFDIESSDASIEYVPVDDLLKIQGKLTLKTPFFKIDPQQGGANITLDLAGDNYLQVKGGVPDIKGSLSVKNVNFTPKWGVSELSVNIKTQNGVVEEVGGKAQVKFPWPSKSIPPKALEAGTEAGFLLPPPKLELDLIGIDVDELNIPIGTSGLFLQKLGGRVNNIAESNPQPVEFSGSVGTTFGPELSLTLPSWLGGQEYKASAVRLDVGGTVSSDKLAGNFDIKIIDSAIYNAKGDGEYNWDKNIISANTSVSALSGIITGTNKFSIDFDQGVASAFGQVALTIPDNKFFWVLRGKQLASASSQFLYTDDGTSSNDYIASWGRVSLPFYGSTTAGLQVFLDGDVDVIWGAKDIPPTNSFDVDPGTQYLLLAADWDNPTNRNIRVRVKDPNGNFIEESEFTANNIAVVDDLTGLNGKTVIVNNPAIGNWDLEVVDDSGLGEVRISGFRDSVAPTIEITAPATDVNGGEVTINYNAFDADSNAEVKLFYDTDNQDFDGILIADGLAETDGAGSFVWNTEGTAPGDYYIYAMVMDENNAPVFSYSPGRVQITEQADLSVTKTASADTVGIGDNLTYTVTVTNNGAVESKGITLVDTLPEGATFVSSTLLPINQVNSDFTFELGNLAAGQSVSFDVTVTPTITGSITNTASVTSRTFDPDVSNDVDFLTTTVVDAIPPEPVDLSVVRTDSPDATMLGEDFTYTLIVTNNSPTPATGVILTENLLSGMNVVSATSSQGTVSTANNAVRVNIGTLNGGETATIPITANSIAAGNLVSTTDVTSDAADLNPTNNSLIQRKTVNPSTPAAADLELSKTVSNPTPNIGELVDLNLTLTNKGPGIASSIRVTDLLPPGLSFVGTQAEQGIYDPITGIWDVGNIRDNLSRTLTITAKVEASGPIVTTAEVTAVSESDPDSTPGNNNPDEDDRVLLTLNSTGNPNIDTELSSDFLRFLKIYGLA